MDPLTATGPAVLEIFSNPDLDKGKSLPIIGDIIFPQEIVDTFVQITGKKVVYSSVFSREGLFSYFPEFNSNETLVNEILGMAEYAVEYGYFEQNRDLMWSRQLNPNILTWKQFLECKGWKDQKLSY